MSTNYYCDICGKELRPSDPRRVVERHRGMLPVHEECAKRAATFAMLALIPESLGGNLKR